MQHCSNALGNIHPVKELIELAKAYGATVVIDGAQAVAHLPIDVQELNCDFYVFSGHKMYGPTGIGVLYYHPRVSDQLSAIKFGGEMVQKVSIEQTTFRALPSLLETGTPNISGVIGLSAAIRFLSTEKTQTAQQQETSLYQYLVSEMSTLPKVILHGDQTNNIGVLSFTVEGEELSDLSALLDQYNIAMRFGHHCAMPLMQSLNVTGTARISLGVYNDKNDIDAFVNALKETLDLLSI